jgi:hypothetical protein
MDDPWNNAKKTPGANPLDVASGNLDKMNKYIMVRVFGFLFFFFFFFFGFSSFGALVCSMVGQ